jgi:hypothetical protein
MSSRPLPVGLPLRACRRIGSKVRRLALPRFRRARSVRKGRKRRVDDVRKEPVARPEGGRAAGCPERPYAAPKPPARREGPTGKRQPDPPNAELRRPPGAPGRAPPCCSPSSLLCAALDRCGHLRRSRLPYGDGRRHDPFRPQVRPRHRRHTSEPMPTPSKCRDSRPTTRRR